MGKGKVSKNSRTSKNVVNTYTKTEKAKKETILVEVTKEVRDEIESTGKANSKEIIRNLKRFGKEYAEVKNV